MRFVPGCNCCGGPPLTSLCCIGGLSPVTWPNGLLRFPGSFGPGYDEAQCALTAYYPFGDLIVEMHGWYLANFPGECWAANIASSYAVPNQATLPGGISHVVGSEGCIWNGSFSLDGPGCGTGNPLSGYSLRISVGIQTANILGARTSIFGPFGAFGAMLDQFGISYAISSSAPNPHDFTAGPIAIPSTTGGVSENLVVHP